MTDIWKKTISLIPEENLVGNMNEIVRQHPKIFTTPVDENDLETSIQTMEKDLESYQHHGHQNDLELDKIKEVLDSIKQSHRKLVGGIDDWKSSLREQDLT